MKQQKMIKESDKQIREKMKKVLFGKHRMLSISCIMQKMLKTAQFHEMKSDEEMLERAIEQYKNNRGKSMEQIKAESKASIQQFNKRVEEIKDGKKVQ